MMGGAAGIAAKLSDGWMPPPGTRREPDHMLSPLAHGDAAAGPDDGDDWVGLAAHGDSGAALAAGTTPHGDVGVCAGVGRRAPPMTPGC